MVWNYSRKSSENFFRIRYPAKDAPLRFDHAKAHFLEFREIGTDAIGWHQTIVAAIVRFADCRIDAHLGGDTGDDELLDAAILQDRVQIGGEERAFTRLVDHGFFGQGVEFRDNVVARFSANENASHRAGI